MTITSFWLYHQVKSSYAISYNMYMRTPTNVFFYVCVYIRRKNKEMYIYIATHSYSNIHIAMASKTRGRKFSYKTLNLKKLNFQNKFVN